MVNRHATSEEIARQEARAESQFSAGSKGPNPSGSATCSAGLGLHHEDSSSSVGAICAKHDFVDALLNWHNPSIALSGVLFFNTMVQALT